MSRKDLTLDVLRKVNSILTTVLCIVMVILAGTLIIPKCLGHQSYIVLSGSMEPVIKTGALVFVNDTDTDNLQENDIITFQIGENIITHRIHEITEDGFITKGDANETVDYAPVSKKQIVGKYMLSIPYLGYFVSWLNSRVGRVVAFWFIGFTLGCSFLIPEKGQKTEKCNITEENKEKTSENGE